MDIAELLAFAVKNNASDLHLAPKNPPIIRVNGDLRRIKTDDVLTNEDIKNMIIAKERDRKNVDLSETERERSKAQCQRQPCPQKSCRIPQTRAADAMFSCVVCGRHGLPFILIW